MKTILLFIFLIGVSCVQMKEPKYKVTFICEPEEDSAFVTFKVEDENQPIEDESFKYIINGTQAKESKRYIFNSTIRVLYGKQAEIKVEDFQNLKVIIFRPELNRPPSYIFTQKSGKLVYFSLNPENIKE